VQLFIHHRVIYRVVTSDAPTRLPWFLRLLLAIPLARRLPAYFVGIGFRPEHVQTADAFAH
jgi:hypothetical protein